VGRPVRGARKSDGRKKSLAKGKTEKWENYRGKKKKRGGFFETVSGGGVGVGSHVRGGEGVGKKLSLSNKIKKEKEEGLKKKKKPDARNAAGRGKKKKPLVRKREVQSEWHAHPI